VCQFQTVSTEGFTPRNCDITVPQNQFLPAKIDFFDELCLLSLRNLLKIVRPAKASTIDLALLITSSVTAMHRPILIAIAE
jgi:hypothetical protein